MNRFDPASLSWWVKFPLWRRWHRRGVGPSFRIWRLHGWWLGGTYVSDPFFLSVVFSICFFISRACVCLLSVWAMTCELNGVWGSMYPSCSHGPGDLPPWCERWVGVVGLYPRFVGPLFLDKKIYAQSLFVWVVRVYRFLAMFSAVSFRYLYQRL
jgi:hypothetical protein